MPYVKEREPRELEKSRTRVPFTMPIATLPELSYCLSSFALRFPVVCYRNYLDLFSSFFDYPKPCFLVSHTFLLDHVTPYKLYEVKGYVYVPIVSDSNAS